MSDRARFLLLVVFVFALVGTATELIIVGHTESFLQWVPLVLIAAAMAVAGWQVASKSRQSVRVFRVTMALFILAGFGGLAAHWQGKIQFKRETNPSLMGLALFLEAMKSQSPPALAPGVFIHLGLLGLVFTYRHPALESKYEGNNL